MLKTNENNKLITGLITITLYKENNAIDERYIDVTCFTVEEARKIRDLIVEQLKVALEINIDQRWATVALDKDVIYINYIKRDPNCYPMYSAGFNNTVNQSIKVIKSMLNE